MSLRCTFGFHNWRWNVTMITETHNRQYSWEQCTRCGKVKDEHKDEYKSYYNPEYEP